MNVLAIDTCFDACSAAAGRGLRSLTPDIAFLFEPMQTGQAEKLMPMVESVMAEAKLKFADLDRITVTCGPGTFTGTRIAVSAARALALATGAAIVPVTSLRLMAMSARIPAGPSPRLVIATDARRDEVYFEVFDRHSMRTLIAPSVMPLATAAEAIKALGPGDVTVAGSGARLLATHLILFDVEATEILPDLLPDAFDMLFESSEWPTEASVSPLYLRAPDAKPPSTQPLSGVRA